MLYDSSVCYACFEGHTGVADMPKEYIYEPWRAPLSIQVKAKCIIGKDYPKPGFIAFHLLLFSNIL